MGRRLNPWSVVGVCLLLMVPSGAWRDGGQLGYMSFRAIDAAQHVYLLYASVLANALIVFLSLVSVRVRVYALLAALASYVFALNAWRDANQYLYGIWQEEFKYSCTKVADFCAGTAIGSSIWIWMIASLLLIVGGIQVWRMGR